MSALASIAVRIDALVRISGPPVVEMAIAAQAEERGSTGVKLVAGPRLTPQRPKPWNTGLVGCASPQQVVVADPSVVPGGAVRLCRAQEPSEIADIPFSGTKRISSPSGSRLKSLT